MIDETYKFLDFLQKELFQVFSWDKKEKLRIKNATILKNNKKNFLKKTYDIYYKNELFFKDICNTKIAILIVECLLQISEIEEEVEKIKYKIEKYRNLDSEEEKEHKNKKIKLLTEKVEEIKEKIKKYLLMDKEYQSILYELFLLKNYIKKKNKNDPKYFIFETKTKILKEKIKNNEEKLTKEIGFMMEKNNIENYHNFLL